MGDQIFISYAREDQNYTRKLVEELHRRGFETWIDDRIDFGDRWWRTIVQAICDSAAFVVVMTPDSYKSKWVDREVMLAEKEGKYIFPLLLRGEVFPLFITTQYADVTTSRLPPEEFYERIGRIAPPKPQEEKKAAPALPQPTPRRLSSGLLVSLGVSILVVIIGVIAFFAGQRGAGGEEVDPTAIAATVVANITAEAAKGITQPEVDLEATVAAAVAATEQARADADQLLDVATDTPTSVPSPTNTPEPLPTSTDIPLPNRTPTLRPTNTPIPSINTPTPIPVTGAVGRGDGVAVQTFRQASTPELAIPDRNVDGVHDTITFSEAAIVSSIMVHIDITHTFRGDLRLTLIAPSGTSVVLYDRGGGTADNIQGDFDLRSTPGLNNLIGQSLQGDWTLHVQDSAALDVGQLNRWELEIEGQIDAVVELEETPPVSSLPQTITATDGSPMVLIPVGPFTMGSESGESNEQPVHTVTLDAFYIDQYEVTNTRYADCVAAGECILPYCTEDYEDPDKMNHPVVCVDWEQANTYCEWRGDRLPTEAEWEKAARGTEGLTYPWGEEPPNESLLNYDGSVGDTTPVGNYPDGVSPYGVYDMAGNVWEWVADWYDGDYYSIAPDHNPQGPETGSEKVLRGGGWTDDVPDARASIRYGNVPGSRYIHNGFRCMAAAPE